MGFRPSRGSLTGKNKRCNYLFASGDSTKIIRWNVKNLSVNFVACEDDIDCVEKDIVFGIKPMTNTRNNPEPFGSLKELREKCRDSARRQLRFNRRKQCVHPNDSATMRCGRTARVCFPIRLRTDSELVSLGIILCVPGFRCAGIADLTVRLFRSDMDHAVGTSGAVYAAVFLDFDRFDVVDVDHVDVADRRSVAENQGGVAQNERTASVDDELAVALHDPGDERRDGGSEIRESPLHEEIARETAAALREVAPFDITVAVIGQFGCRRALCCVAQPCDADRIASVDRYVDLFFL